MKFTLTQSDKWPFGWSIVDQDKFPVCAGTMYHYSTRDKTLEDVLKRDASNQKVLDYAQLLQRAPELEAENARLLVENAQYKEIEAANKETIQYWMGGYTIHSERVADLEKEAEELRGEVARLRELLTSAYPYVEDMIGIASGARGTKADIDLYFEQQQLKGTQS